jgi:hypothetical protein
VTRLVTGSVVVVEPVGRVVVEPVGAVVVVELVGRVVVEPVGAVVVVELVGRVVVEPVGAVVVVEPPATVVVLDGDTVVEVVVVGKALANSAPNWGPVVRPTTTTPATTPHQPRARREGFITSMYRDDVAKNGRGYRRPRYE